MNEMDKCPVCATRTQADGNASGGLILTALNAVLDNDNETIQYCYEQFTPFDAHIAVTLLLVTMNDLCRLVGVNLRIVLDDYRRRLNASQASS